jgi:hypothetical protein
MLPATTDPLALDHPHPAAEPAWRFAVRGLLEPSVLSRVIEMFVLRDLIPHQVASRAVDDELRIDLAVRGLSAQQAEHLAQRIRQFPAVLGVLLQR